ncbi:hypothetical protein MTO96_000254 [Rhipicephalus appendiculatus]
MTMSSFLMNSPSYVDPKFPPPEEYSQGNYIPSHGAGDYYAGAPPHHHHHAAAHPYATFGGAAAPPYGAENGGYVSSASPHYYQHSCSMTQTTLSPLSRPSVALDHAGAGGGHSPPYSGPPAPLQRSPSPPAAGVHAQAFAAIAARRRSATDAQPRGHRHGADFGSRRRLQSGRTARHLSLDEKGARQRR